MLERAKGWTIAFSSEDGKKFEIGLQESCFGCPHVQPPPGVWEHQAKMD